MKRLFLLLSSLICMISASSQGVHIYLKTGYHVIYKADNIDSLVFFNDASRVMTVILDSIVCKPENKAYVYGRWNTDNSFLKVSDFNVCSSTFINPDTSTIVGTHCLSTKNSSNDKFRFTISGLIEGQQYFVRCFAENQYGITYSNEETFIYNQIPFTPTWVDLGLSVKWATCNIGAYSPEDAASCFPWGDVVEPDTLCSWDTYKYSVRSVIMKYNRSDNKTTLEAIDDAATYHWGSPWRMPTKTEMEELLNRCTWTKSTYNGVKGYTVRGPSGNSIFLPYDLLVYRASSSGLNFYWTSTLYSDSYCDEAYSLTLTDSGKSLSKGYRYGARSVRAVCP